VLWSREWLKQWIARKPVEALEYIPKGNLDNSLMAELQDIGEKSLEVRREHGVD
jgi:hypothetical protein